MEINTIGLLLTFILLIFLIFKGWNIWIISIISTLFLALTNSLNIEEVIFETYSSFFKNFVGNWFLLFILSSIFGKIMEKSGASVIIAKSLASKIEEKRAILIILIITFILSYGGINIFVIVFSVYPICLFLFSKLNIPKEVCPGLILAIPASITMVVFPGTPSIQNTIPTKYFGTTIYSAPLIGILTSIFIFLCDYYFYSYVIKKLKKTDKKFILDEGEKLENIERKNTKLEIILAYTPLLTLLVINYCLINIFAMKSSNFALCIGISISIILSIVIFRKNLNIKKDLEIGIKNGIEALFTTASIISFGGVVSKTTAFKNIIDWTIKIKASPLTSMFIVINIICMVTASSVGGLTIYLENFSLELLKTGIPVEILHRMSAIASSGLDAMPFASGIIVVNTIAKTKLKDTYKYIFVSQCIVPMLSYGVACFLYFLKIN
ncbi:MAG: GntP family permease [Fusobacterium periodonticum]|jgi:membrane protein|nr:GntP family permease [Fusobacterium periodonticum]